MKRYGFRNRNRGAGKLITAALLGSVVGATVSLLMAPSSGHELRRRIKGQFMGGGSAYEKAQAAARNGENRARELAAHARYHLNEMKGAVSHRGEATPSAIPEVS